MKQRIYLMILVALLIGGAISKTTAQNLCTKVRVLVVYSDKLGVYWQNSKGGVHKLLDKIDDLEREVNTAFRNSGVNHQISVVGKIRISDYEAYEDPPNLTDTDVIRTAIDRCSAANSETSEKRRLTRADLVIVLKRNSGNKVSGGSARGQAKGVSFVDPSNPHNNNIYHLAVMDDGAFTGNPKYTFTHELGHLYGAQHDKQTLDDQLNNGFMDDAINYFFPAANSTQYGFVRNNATNPFRTIMSYKQYCSHCAWADVVQNFSNPSVNVNVGGTNYSSGSANANNVQGINNAYPYIRSLTTVPETLVWNASNLFNNEFVEIIAKEKIYLMNTTIYENSEMDLIAPAIRILASAKVRIRSSGGNATTLLHADPCGGGGSDLLPLNNKTLESDYDKYINGVTLQVNIFPNPHQNQFNLDFETRVPGDVGYKIFDQTGKVIYSKSFGELEYGRYQETVDTKLFPKGFYILKMTLGSEYITSVKLTKI